MSKNECMKWIVASRFDFGVAWSTFLRFRNGVLFVCRFKVFAFFSWKSIFRIDFFQIEKENSAQSTFYKLKNRLIAFGLKNKHLKCVFSFDTPNTHLCVSMSNPAYSFLSKYRKYWTADRDYQVAHSLSRLFLTVTSKNVVVFFASVDPVIAEVCDILFLHTQWLRQGCFFALYFVLFCSSNQFYQCFCSLPLEIIIQKFKWKIVYRIDISTWKVFTKHGNTRENVCGLIVFEKTSSHVKYSNMSTETGFSCLTAQSDQIQRGDSWREELRIFQHMQCIICNQCVNSTSSKRYCCVRKRNRLFHSINSRCVGNHSKFETITMSITQQHTWTLSSPSTWIKTSTKSSVPRKQCLHNLFSIRMVYNVALVFVMYGACIYNLNTYSMCQFERALDHRGALKPFCLYIVRSTLFLSPRHVYNHLEWCDLFIYLFAVIYLASFSFFNLLSKYWNYHVFFLPLVVPLEISHHLGYETYSINFFVSLCMCVRFR